MKLLFLSLCGRDNEDEDVRGLNLFFASLRRHVISHFDTRVILFSTFNAKERTQARIDAFGLTPYVDLRRIDDMELPEAAKTALSRTHYFPKIGIYMNMLFDFAKQHNFYDADWIFHTDTDIEFLNNFSEHLLCFEAFSKINPRVLISCAGDSYPAFIRYKDKEYLIKPAHRWNIYTEPFFPDIFSMQFEELHSSRVWHPDQLGEWLTFEPEHLKIRNDFIGISREAAKYTSFNWVSMSGNLFKCPTETRNKENEDNNTDLVLDWWSRHEENTKLPLRLQINKDKGGALLYDIKTGNDQLTWIQLRIYQDMAKHYGSGWEQQKNNYITASYAILKKDYMDTASIWKDDPVD